MVRGFINTSFDQILGCGLISLSEAAFKIIANNPPSISIAIGGLMLLIGYTLKEGGLVIAGWIFFICGFVLQVLWLTKN